MDKVVICVLPESGFTTLAIVRLTRNAEAPSLARQEVTRVLGLDHPAIELLWLTTSELVTNAVKHVDPGNGRDWVEIALAEGCNTLRVAVTDPGSLFTAPYFIPQQPWNLASAVDGRGLYIVNKLSKNRWGSHLLPGSKHRVVWCHLDANPLEEEVDLLYSIAV